MHKKEKGGSGLKSNESAQIIWNWYEKFIVSKDFKKITTIFEREFIVISGVIDYKLVSPGFYEQHFLAIRLSDKKLSIYIFGKSLRLFQEIENLNDLLVHVKSPALTEIAETILNHTILQKILKQNGMSG